MKVRLEYSLKQNLFHLEDNLQSKDRKGWVLLLHKVNIEVATEFIEFYDKNGPNVPVSSDAVRSILYKYLGIKERRIPESEVDSKIIEFAQTKGINKLIAEQKIPELGWYQKEIIRMLLELGSYRAIEMVTGIHYTSCFKSVQKGLKCLSGSLEKGTSNDSNNSQVLQDHFGGKLFTRKDVARIFGIKPETIYFWERDGIIKPSMYVRNRPRYTQEAVDNCFGYGKINHAN